jgi:hypothetical protein
MLMMIINVFILLILEIIVLLNPSPIRDKMIRITQNRKANRLKERHHG